MPARLEITGQSGCLKLSALNSIPFRACCLLFSSLPCLALHKNQTKQNHLILSIHFIVCSFGPFVECCFFCLFLVCFWAHNGETTNDRLFLFALCILYGQNCSAFCAQNDLKMSVRNCGRFAVSKVLSITMNRKKILANHCEISRAI